MKVHAPSRRSAPRKGYVLFAVLLVTVVLSLTAYRFTDSMVTENTVAVRSAEQVQAKLAAVSGVHYAASILADPNAMAGLGFDVSDHADLFSGQLVGTRGRFNLINVSEALDGAGTGEARYPLRYGIVDEGGKININALIEADPTGNVLFTALMTLPLPPGYPYTLEQVADSIVDWVDADSTTRPNGLEDYSGMATPYQCKNGPLNSIDELLLVQGVTSELLFGNDRNRNGRLDAGEADSADFSRGWSEYLTCYGREINVDSQGQPRINLNGTDLATLSEQLTELLGQELSDYILYYRISGNATAFTPELASDKVAAPVSQLRDLVQSAIDSGKMASRKVASVITVWNTQINLPRPPALPPPGGRGPPIQQPQPVVACPINDPAKLKEVLVTLLDKCTTNEGVEITPRINVNTAPLSVLTALPGLTPADVTTIVNARAGQSMGDPAVSTGAWLLTVAEMPPDKFKVLEPYISGRSWTFRVHSVGSTGPSGTRGRVSRVEAVIDVGTRTTDGNFIGLPRIVYFRDLSDLGRGFAELP